MDETLENCFETEDWGLIDYAEAWRRQEHCFEQLISAKLKGVQMPANRWILCEHSPVITLGRHGNAGNLLRPVAELAALGIAFYQIDRGGDITFHGPGQLVGYPIFDLDGLHIGLKQYVTLLEEAVICTLRLYGVTATRLAGATGVWLDAGTPKSRKICAIGVRSSHFVTMHGFALNVNTDLTQFTLINPCGFCDKGVTSLSAEVGATIDMDEVKQRITAEACRLFGTCADTQ